MALEFEFAVLDEVMVTEELVVAVELLLEVDELALAPREETRLPPVLPRLPCSRGAVIAAKRSAAIDPPTRNVRCTSPTATTAVRVAAVTGPPPPSLGASRSRFK